MINLPKTGFSALVVAVILAFSMASGCSLLSTVSENENQLAVQYATLKVIERDDVSADRIQELVSEAKSYVQDGISVSVATLADEARERLRESSLSPADQVIVDIILTRAEERISARIGEGILSGDQRLQLLTVLNWIEDAARGNPLSP